MFKSLTFRCKLDNINLMTPAQLTELGNKVLAAIRAINPDAAMDQNVEVEEITPKTQHTALGAAAVDGYMEVKRAATGKVEHFHNLNGQSYPISKEVYDDAHASPAMQAQLKAARETAGVAQ